MTPDSTAFVPEVTGSRPESLSDREGRPGRRLRRFAEVLASCLLVAAIGVLAQPTDVLAQPTGEMSLRADVLAQTTGLRAPMAGANLGPGTALPDEATSPQATPGLVVLVVIDQLRADLLDRYAPVFSGGLARLREEGFRFRQATHDFSITLTAPGHASISTGTLPWKHGVVSNAWFERDGAGWRTVENVLDPAVPLAHDPSLPGASPAVLERDGLAHWLTTAHPEARIVTVSAKARAAVLMGPRQGGLALWFEDQGPRFVTSTHYAEAEPAWLAEFNREVLPGLAGDWTWNLQVPEPFHGLARPDSAVYEGDGVHTTFPHRFEDSEFLVAQDQPWVWWATTPALDRATRLLAQRAAEEQELGTDEVPDLLAVSLSQTDRVGHAYGPLSLEQLDNLYRLDRELGELLDWLDERYGRAGYLLALTADHGVADNPEAVLARGGRALRVTRDSALALQQRLNEVATGLGNTDAGSLAGALAAAMPEISWIDAAWTTGALADLGTAARSGDATGDSLAVFQAHSHFPGRYTGILARQSVEVRLTPNTLTWAYPRGTTHGSPYHYDRHVPFILLGAGVPPGVTDQRVSTTDVAPTLARLLGIPYPHDLDGVARSPGDGGGG